MGITELHQRGQLTDFLQRDPALHLYALGDLDDIFFPLTRWYGWKTKDSIAAIVMLYAGFQPPILHALCPPDELHAMRALLVELTPALPGKFYAHLTPGIEAILAPHFEIIPEGRHWKMMFTHPKQLPAAASERVVRLSSADLPALRQLYSQASPGNAFEARLLESNHYFGIYQQRKLVCAAGIHVYSPKYNVAAVGNVVTHPDFRSRGYARETVAFLCRALRQSVTHIGLNVRADNSHAVRLYQGLGFTYSSEHDECTLIAA